MNTELELFRNFMMNMGSGLVLLFILSLAVMLLAPYLALRGGDRR